MGAMGALRMNIATSAQAYRLIRDKLLEQLPELADDPECLLDTLEGLTTINEQLAALIRSAVNDEAMAEGLQNYQLKLADRRRAFETRANRKRIAVLHYMTDLDLKNVTAPDLTVTRKNTAPAVIITDETALPDEFVRVKREPDKPAIKKALTAGETVAGATMSNGSQTLQVKI
jgi:phage host-nuclease inhibitor protein Gam